MHKMLKDFHISKDAIARIANDMVDGWSEKNWETFPDSIVEVFEYLQQFEEFHNPLDGVEGRIPTVHFDLLTIKRYIRTIRDVRMQYNVYLSDVLIYEFTREKDTWEIKTHYPDFLPHIFYIILHISEYKWKEDKETKRQNIEKLNVLFKERMI